MIIHSFTSIDRRVFNTTQESTYSLGTASRSLVELSKMWFYHGLILLTRAWMTRHTTPMGRAKHRMPTCEIGVTTSWSIPVLEL